MLFNAAVKMIPCMAKTKQKPEPNGDNRKFKVRKPLLDRLDQLAERNATDVTELVNQAVRELLERAGMWPPGNEAAPWIYQRAARVEVRRVELLTS